MNIRVQGENRLIKYGVHDYKRRIYVIVKKKMYGNIRKRFDGDKNG